MGALLNVQRELEMKCEALETTATGESSEAAAALSELRQLLNTTTERLKATQAELEEVKNKQVRQLNEQLNSTGDTQDELKKCYTKLQNEEQQCQALLELVMSSTHRLLGHEEPEENVVNKNTFTLKFKEAFEEIEKMLKCSVCDYGDFISEGETRLDQL